MKRIKPLTEVERDTLEAGRHYGPTARFRQRCHAILLNAQGYRLGELAEVFGVHPTTVSDWLNRWAHQGIGGLYDSRRPGRPPIYQQQELELLQQFLAEDPRRLKQAQARLEQATGKRACLKTLQRALKKVGLPLEAVPPQSGEPTRRGQVSPGPEQAG